MVSICVRSRVKPDGSLHLDEKDEIISSTLLTRDGDVVNSLVREFLSLPASADKH